MRILKNCPPCEACGVNDGVLVLWPTNRSICRPCYQAEFVPPANALPLICQGWNCGEPIEDDQERVWTRGIPPKPFHEACWPDGKPTLAPTPSREDNNR